MSTSPQYEDIVNLAVLPKWIQMLIILFPVKIPAEFPYAEKRSGTGPQSWGRAGLEGTVFWGGVPGCAPHFTAPPTVSCRPLPWRPLPSVTLLRFLSLAHVISGFLCVLLFQFCFLWKGLGFLSSLFRKGSLPKRIIGALYFLLPSTDFRRLILQTAVNTSFCLRKRPLGTENPPEIWRVLVGPMQLSRCSFQGSVCAGPAATPVPRQWLACAWCQGPHRGLPAPLPFYVLFLCPRPSGLCLLCQAPQLHFLSLSWFSSLFP